MTERLFRAWVTDAVRTPIGKRDGLLARYRVEQLVAPLIRALCQRHPALPALVDEVIIGNAAGPGGNVGRLSALEAGLPVSVPGLTVDRQCGSGLEAINLGARLIQSGAARVVIAGGVESASTAPLRAYRTGGNADEPTFYTRARFSPDTIGDPDMGIAAENVARRYGITREQADHFAWMSHRKTIAAREKGVYARELVPLPPAVSDECPRADCSLTVLQSLPPVFSASGQVTAGNACPINDGACVVLLVSAELMATEFSSDVSPMAFRASASVGVDPHMLGIGPVPATQALLQRLNLSISDISQVELTEAFAAQVLACQQQLSIPENRLNPYGGALALGHPYGASGALLVCRLFHGLSDGETGIATLGIGGGIGLSSAFNRE